MTDIVKNITTVLVVVFFCAYVTAANPFVSPAEKAPESQTEQDSSAQTNNVYENTPESTDTVKQVMPVRASAPSRNLVQQQGRLRSQLAAFLYQLKDPAIHDGTRRRTIGSVLLIAFLYGILHAAGPGHRKTIVFSMYIARSSPLWEPAAVGLTISLLHGLCAVFLLLAFRGVSGSISSHTDNYALYLEGFSYILLIITSCALIIHETRHYLKGRKSAAAVNSGGTDKVQAVSLASFIISGIYPCPGAILVLVLAHTLDIVNAGIIAVTAMSFGMSIPIIISAYLGRLGHTGLFKIVSDNKRTALAASFTAEIIGLTFLLIIAVYTASPFIISLIRM